MTLSLDVFTTILNRNRHCHSYHHRSDKNLNLWGSRRSRHFICVHARKNTTSNNITTSVADNHSVPAAAADSARGAVISGRKTPKFNVRANVTVRNKSKKEFHENIMWGLDAIADWFGNHVTVELVSVDVDPETKIGKRSAEGVIKDWFRKSGDLETYIVVFSVDTDFGVPGAILVANKHQQEFFLDNITVEGFYGGLVHFPCDSWIQPHRIHPKKRIFFSNMPYFAEETPEGLKDLREEELKDLRGDGTGERKLPDRIYDFDVYNDLGNPDKGIDFVRPTLGTGGLKYPRRCRTGRPPCISDANCESRVEKPLPMYVPRDESFVEPKRLTFSFGTYKGQLRNLKPVIQGRISPESTDVKSFSDLDKLYRRSRVEESLKDMSPVPKTPVEAVKPGIFKFDVPKILTKDKFAWLRDDEFTRQAIAGVNPVSIERMKVFPPVSNLDPQAVGSLESALKEESILPFLDGMSVQQALDQNKLYMLDYHDIYLPFVDRINALDGHKAYATRTIYFLTDANTLRPVAIELSLSPGSPSSRAKRVVTPASDATSYWIWQMAKLHVAANDAGVHQLAYHWLRTHACLEPFIIAAHRQLSVMHPIYKLLDPHMRYNLHINAFARQRLISNSGVIESCFSPGRWAMEISAVAYKHWRFDMEGLPSDLIRRGVAVPDATMPHGLRLLIEDYPYANDGLLVWSAIEKWVNKYVNHYYHDPSRVANDKELQAWYSEAINVGHADHKDAEWWPKLSSPENLSKVLTILIWLASALHAALNFGQYSYGGYLPNRPPLVRRLIPDENDVEYENFVSDPEKYFLLSLPNTMQMTKYMAVVDSLSTHSPDEEYLGQRAHPSFWTGDSAMIEAFYEFGEQVYRVEKEIQRRNQNPSFKNRFGAGVVPYELLAPISEPGVTCRGIPNSCSI